MSKTISKSFLFLVFSFCLAGCGKSIDEGSSKVTWLNSNESVLLVQHDIPEGTLPQYPAGEPVNPNNPQESYFVGWTPQIQLTEAGKNYTYKAVYYDLESPTYFKVFYDLDGGVNNPDNPDFFAVDDYFILKDPSKSGYDFAGWYDQNGKRVTRINGSTLQDIYLTATWTLAKYIVNITCNLPELGLGDSFVLGQNEYFYYSAPYVEDYVFNGWYSNGIRIQTDYEYYDFVVCDLNLEMNYTKLTSYKINVISNIPSLPIDYSETIYYPGTFTYSAPSVSGYKFNGWYGNGSFITSALTLRDYPIYEDTLFVLNYSKIYNVYYDLGGGINSPYNPSSVSQNDGLIYLQSPSRSNYDFLYWIDQYGNEVIYIDCLDLTSDLYLTAVWDAHMYDIYVHIDQDDLTYSNNYSCAYGECMSLVPNEYEGWIFNWWVVNGVIYETNELTFYVTQNYDIELVYTPVYSMEYMPETNSYKINCYNGETSDVNIPETYKGLPVTVIGDNAFGDCYAIDKIYIPDSITTIESCAFANSSISSLTGGASVVYIGPSAFENCPLLTTVDFSTFNNLKEIDSYAFYGTSLSGSMTIPASVTIIGNECFSQIETSCKFYLVNDLNIEWIGSRAFSYSPNMSVEVVYEAATQRWASDWYYEIHDVYYFNRLN